MDEELFDNTGVLPPSDPRAVREHGQATGLEGEAPIDAPPPKPVPLRQIDWSLFIQDPNDPITDPNWCVWCHFAQSRQQYKDNKRFEVMARYYKENISYVEPFLFVAVVQEIYNDCLRGNLIDKQGKRFRGPAWPARSIWEHSTVHILSPQSVRERTARCMANALRVLEENGIFLQDSATGQMTVDVRMLTQYSNIWKILQPLLDKLEGSRNTDLYGID